MSYIKIIDTSKQKIYNQAVAQRILGLIDKLRLNSNENNERRWIWELLQNAKDVAFENQPVSILINFIKELTEPVVEFKHNGKPFSIDNITFLIEQVSTKDRETNDSKKPKPTGKFGTGFLTTHLLSEKVELESIVKEPDLPFKKFNILLDRSGRTIDDIIKSVNDSLKVLQSLDEYETYSDFDHTQYNTTFKYLLDANGIKTAKKGLEDFDICLPFTLAFVPSLQTIRINSETTYNLFPETSVLKDGIEIYTIQKESIDGICEYNIAVLSSNRVSIAVEVLFNNGTISIKKCDPKLPRLFCDFPLIGSEDFNSPIIINSNFFNPTEERDGVYLADKSDSKIIENKMLIIEAKDLYFKLLDFAAQNNWMNMHVLADISLPKTKDWISKEWMNELIIDPCRSKLLQTPMVDTSIFGRIPIECGEYNDHLKKNATIDFPKHRKEEILQKLWHLCNNQYFILPVESDFLSWSKVIWDNKYIVDLKSIVKLIETKENLAVLSGKIGKTYTETISWLNDFYNLLIIEGEVIKDISQNNIYPNQNGRFKRKDELYCEAEEISETLKDIVKDLGDDIRERMADNAIIYENMRNNSCFVSTVANQIIKLIRPRLSEIPRTEETCRIFKHMYLWFIQNKKVAEENFDDLYKNKHKLLDDNEIVSSLEKAELFDQLLDENPNLSIERIQELLEIEALSKGFQIDFKYNPDEEETLKNFRNGWKGEAFVYKILIREGEDVSWPNKSIFQTSNDIIDFEGDLHYIDDKSLKYDLIVQSSNNTKSFIQVKSTSTDISQSDKIAMPISVREWKFINEKDANDNYYLARVFNVESHPEVYFMKVDNSI